MKFAEKIFERATVKGVADYLLYGMVPDRDDRSYEARLDDADLAYEKVAKQYDEDGASVLLSAADILANEHDSVYMKLGLQAGFLLFTNLFRNICSENDNVTDTALEETLRKDRKYQDTQMNACKKREKLERDMFTAKQWNLIEEALEESNASVSEYGRIAYQQGLMDILNFLADVWMKRRR